MKILVAFAFASICAAQYVNLSQYVDSRVTAATCTRGCAVTLPAGDFIMDGPIVLSRPGLRLTGQGARATRLHYTGQAGTAAVVLQMVPFTIDGHNAIEGLSIVLETPGTTALLTGDVTSAIFRDLLIDCQHQSGSHGIHAQLTHGWFERNLFEAVDVKYCATGMELSVSPSAQFNSFGYNKFVQVGFNVASGQHGVVVGSGAMLYHSRLDWNVNVDDGTLTDGTAFIVVAGTVQSNRYDITGESAQPTTGIRVLPGGIWKHEPASTIMLDNMTGSTE